MADDDEEFTIHECYGCKRGINANAKHRLLYVEYEDKFHIRFCSKRCKKAFIRYAESVDPKPPFLPVVEC